MIAEYEIYRDVCLQIAVHDLSAVCRAAAERTRETMSPVDRNRLAMIVAGSPYEARLRSAHAAVIVMEAA